MDIGARQVIPVVGPELLVLGGGAGQLTLYQHLARELVSRCSLDAARLGDDYGLLDVTSLFFQDPRNRAADLTAAEIAELVSNPCQLSHTSENLSLGLRLWITPAVRKYSVRTEISGIRQKPSLCGLLIMCFLLPLAGIEWSSR
jgi:hypothetical protein